MGMAKRQKMKWNSFISFLLRGEFVISEQQLRIADTYQTFKVISPSGMYSFSLRTFLWPTLMFLTFYFSSGYYFNFKTKVFVNGVISIWIERMDQDDGMPSCQ
ncbi:hypothetical protein L1049_001347 [Liquidambar formosana]|uniref:Uncharacterized protein n=1 Tax=Liquidambar formosana TaxID=63359 RepID=A0AAP0NCN1_LIQFO